MRVVFLSASEVGWVRHRKEAGRDVAETRYGAADILAFSGKVKAADRDMVRIEDREELSIRLSKDAEAPVEGAYVIVYGTPRMRGTLQIAAEGRDSIVEVDEATCRRFYEIRRRAEEYLLERAGEIDEDLEAAEGPSDEEILGFVKDRDKGDGAPLGDILSRFGKYGNIKERLTDLMEAGELYEPKAGRLRRLG